MLPSPESADRHIVIYLARHGEKRDNVPPMRLMGHRDSPLSDAGHRQAVELARAARQAGIASVYTSPLARARDTALVVGRALGLEAMIEERLMESSRGSWEGRLIEEIARKEPQLWASWQQPPPSFRFPNGESLEEHVARVRGALARMATAAKPALAVCHGGTIRCALLEARGLGTEHFHELQVPHATLIALDDSS